MKTDEEIQKKFMFGVLMGNGGDPELKQLCKEMDSVSNLNSNPMAIRSAGYNAMRRAFLLGAKWIQEGGE
jgi:hypothetical protein